MTTHGSKFLKVLAPVAFMVIGAVIALSVIKHTLHRPSPTSSAVPSAVGQEVPNFELNRLDNVQSHLGDVKAKVILINFWATWCEACMIEMPSIVKLRQMYASRGLEILLLNIEENPQNVVPPVLKKLKIDFPVYVDKDQKISDLFDVHGIPFTVIIDSNRKILMIETGERDWNDASIQRKMEEWLK